MLEPCLPQPCFHMAGSGLPAELIGTQEVIHCGLPRGLDLQLLYDNEFQADIACDNMI